METNQTTDGEKAKRHVHRSPAYPAIALEQALEKARIIYQEDKRFPVSRGVILKHMGFPDEKSGMGNRVLAATKQYGLVEEDESAFKISDLGYKLLFLSTESADRPALLKAAALSPKIFKDLWERYGSGGSNDNLSDFLIHQKEFNPSSVTDVVGVYRETLKFASLGEADKIESKLDKETSKEEPNPIKVGDYVQWTSAGVWQFDKPRLVRKISDDGLWAFVEGGNTGMPLEELTAEARPDPSIESTNGEASKPRVEAKMRREPPVDREQRRLLDQELVISIPRKFRVDINVLGDELRREDLIRIKNQFNRWIEGLEEAFD